MADPVMRPMTSLALSGADRVLAFIREFITVLDPRTKRAVPMVLYPSQRRFVRGVFDPLTADGRRIMRRGLFGAPKKVGKSSLFAALMLYVLLMELEPHREIVLVAWDLDQTEVLFNAAKGMIQRDARLRTWITSNSVG